MTGAQRKVYMIAQRVIARFDWDQVAAQFKANNWTWLNEKETPTADRLREVADSMAWAMASEGSNLVSSGRLSVAVVDCSRDGKTNYMVNVFIGECKSESESGYDRMLEDEAWEVKRDRIIEDLLAGA